MKYDVKQTPRATEEIEEAERWWAFNRSYSSVTLSEAIEALKESLRDKPRVGRIYRKRDPIVYRELVLHPSFRANWHLYWRIDEVNKIIIVVTLWPARKRSSPKL